MSTKSDHVTPEWTLGDRMAKARKVAGISAQQMADRMRITRQTISNYEHDRVTVPFAVVLIYASETGVDLDWLAERTDHPFGRRKIAAGRRTSASGWKLTMRELPLAA